MPVSNAISPGGISSFFEICNVDATGNRLADPRFIGARGGGFTLKRGVTARVSVGKSRKARISIRINSKPAPEAKTTHWAIQRLMHANRSTLNVKVDLRVDLPIGAGYGTSAAGTAASCLALSDAAQFPVTFNEIGELTHVAEIVNRTGLGTASAILVGGFVLVIEPGAPGIGQVDRLPFPVEHSIICVYLEPTPTRSVLSQPEIAGRVNPAGRAALKVIRRDPCLMTFLAEARKFAAKSGFLTKETSRIINIMIGNGAIGASQNMLGKAVHGVAANHSVQSITRQVKREFRAAKIFVSTLDDRGVRLTGN